MIESKDILYSYYQTLTAFTENEIAIPLVVEHRINLKSVDAIIKEYQRHYFDDYFEPYSIMYKCMKNGLNMPSDNTNIIYQYEKEEVN